MKKKLLILVAVLILALPLTSCDPSSTEAVDTDKNEVTPCALLEETEDMGNDYIDSFLFFGESTTYHMKNRGVLSGGKNTKQILADKSGTAILDSSTYKMTVISTVTGKPIPLEDAISEVKPKYMLLTFGLNGAVRNVAKGEEYFRSCYQKLINTVRSASPNTKIILGSCFPVAENMDMKSYTVSLEELNDHIRLLNEWTHKLCEDEGIKYLNFYEVFVNENGALKMEYQTGDGHHLTKDAYLVLLNYIRTHGYK